MNKETENIEQAENKALHIGGVSKRTFNTLKNIDAETKPMVDRVSQKGYVMNGYDNLEMKMRIDALKSVLYGC
tara:strand:- start:986 stop:1204 length:219 start_codon:yes stop_codon:yes gene_type:complete